MIVKNYKSSGEEITYTLDYDLFSADVEHKKTSTGIIVTDLNDLFSWLEEQGISVDPKQSINCRRNTRFCNERA